MDKKQGSAGTKNTVKIKATKEGIYLRRTSIIYLVLIAVLGAAVYANSIHGKFLWDDRLQIKDNIYIKSWSNIFNVFTVDLGASASSLYNSYDFYRPVQMITYMLDYSLGGLNPAGYHITNIILHILAALSIYWFLNTLYADRMMSFFAAALFVVHPIHTEAVSYVAGRADPLAAFFMMLAFIFYIKALEPRKNKSFIFSLICFAAALFSKEYSLIFPVLLLVYHYAFKKKIRISRLSAVLGLILFYGLLRASVLKATPPTDMSSATLSERLPGFFVALTNYARLLLLPFDLHMEHGSRLFGFGDPGALSGIAILAAATVYVVIKRKNMNVASFAIIWFFAALLPVSNLYPINAYMAEHWLYVPSIGFFLILASGISLLCRNVRWRIFALIVFTGLIAFYSVLTVRQNGYWADPVRFYLRTIEYGGNMRIYSNLGNEYLARGDYDKAREAYEKALVMDPNSSGVANNLANIYLYKDENEKAIELYKKAINLKPDLVQAYVNIANAYNNMGNSEEAIRYCRDAIKINPNLADAYNNLGNAYRKIGKAGDAVKAYKKAVELNPNFAIGHMNLALVYYDMGQYDLAAERCGKAAELGYKVDPAFLELLAKHKK